ncbi:MAG: hypothetical protein H0W99_03685 [Acidobacteria bacterium]|nr:hypothetical protein [Acidobacteriota bacterium]
MDSSTPQQSILSVLAGGVSTWDVLKGLTRLNDERLGFTIGELLGLRKIWTTQKNGVRVYGLERRKGLLPQASHQSRRAADQIDMA